MTSFIEKALERLESGQSVPGTQIVRTLAEVGILRRAGIKVPAEKQDKDAILVWTVGIGPLVEPKRFYNGLTVKDALMRALEDL